MKTRKWMALGATLATMLVAAVALGEDPALCQQAYLASGLTEQQMTLEQFGALYGDAFCVLEEE
jgi:hypothetical protein